MVDGISTEPFSATTLPPISSRTGSEEKVIAVCRERYAEPRASIEEKILRWSGMEAVGATAGLSYPDILTADERTVLEEGGAKSPPAPLEEAPIAPLADDQVEYLRISPERLSAITKPPSATKKDKPKFSHTCTRCGKTWDMPIKLDPTKPMYCAECLPIVKEERLMKKTVMKTAFKGPVQSGEGVSITVEDSGPANRESAKKLGKALEDGEPSPKQSAPRDEERPNRNGTVETQRPNSPRVIGERRPLPPAPPKGTVTITRSGESEPLSLMEELQKAKGKEIETDKRKLEGRPPEKDAKKHDQGDRKKAPPVPERRPLIPRAIPVNTETPKPRLSEDESEVQEDAVAHIPSHGTTTVFRQTVSSVRQNGTTGQKPLKPGETVTFD
jgi:hypothetical protein